MKRSTVADVAKRANVSVTTVDRVINRRVPVSKNTTLKVLRAAKELDFRATSLIYDSLAKNHKKCVLGVVLQSKASPFYRLLGEAISHMSESLAIGCRVEICYLDDLTTKTISNEIETLASYVDVIGVVAADHPRLNETIASVTQSGVPVFSLLSPISSPYITDHISVDLSQFSRTAGWHISSLAHKSGSVGLILGSQRYLGQEVYRAGFRAVIQEKRPDLNIVDAVVSLENPLLAQQATEELLAQYPDLVAIYCGGGGIEGVINALHYDNSGRKIIVVCHELTEVTAEALRSGMVDVVLSCRRESLAKQLIESAVKCHEQKGKYAPQTHKIPFDMFCQENIG